MKFWQHSLYIYVLFIGFLTCTADLLAQERLKDSLVMELKKAKEYQKRKTIYLNLVDVTTQDLSVCNFYRKELLLEACKRKDESGILEAARELSNSFENKLLVLALNKIKPLPNTSEKRGVELILCCQQVLLVSEILSTEERNKKIAKYLDQAKQKGKLDIYEHYSLLFKIYNYYDPALLGSMHLKCAQNMVELSQDMDSVNSYIQNHALSHLAITYTFFQKKTEAVATDFLLLDAINKLEASYKKKGRSFRNFDIGKFQSYVRILSNSEVLTKSKQEEIQKLAWEIYTRNHWVRNLCTNEDPYYLVLRYHYLRKEKKALQEMLKYKALKEKEGLILFLHEYEMLSNLCEAQQDYENQIKVLEELDSLTRHVIFQKGELALYEMGWHYEISDFSKLQKELSLKKMLSLEHEQKAYLFLEQLNKRKQIDSIKQEAERIKLLARNNQLNNESKQAAIQKKISEIRQQELQVFYFLFFLFLLACIIGLTYYAYIYIKRKNHRLFKIQRNIISASKKAQQSDKLKTQFIQNMSHEIRTPLNAIVGFSAILCEKYSQSNNKEVQVFSEIIEKNSELLLNLVNDILDLASLESGRYVTKHEKTFIESICREATDSVTKNVKEGVKLYCKIDCDPNFSFKTDPSRLKQLLVNLLMNSTKFTHKGEITLCCCNDIEKKELIFTVTDTGIGIPPEKANLIFNRFEKLNTFEQGFGLGLNLCLLIAKRLNGHIKLDTTYTSGARIVFSHPY